MLAVLVPFLLPPRHTSKEYAIELDDAAAALPDEEGDSSDEELDEAQHLSPMVESEDEEIVIMRERHKHEDKLTCLCEGGFNLLAELPAEVLFHVLQFLNPKHLLNLRLTSRWSNEVCGDDHLWRGFFARRWPSMRHYGDPALGSTSSMAGWAQAYERMEWRTNRPLMLKGWLYDFPSLFSEPLDRSRDVSPYRRERYYETEMTHEGDEEVLQVQFFLSNCDSSSSSSSSSSSTSSAFRREKKATVWYSNDERGWAWNRTLADVSGGVRPPLKATTASAVVISINTTLVGLDKRTGLELWRRKDSFCNYLVRHADDSDAVYAVGCDDVVYEGRVVVRERPLMALDARTGREVWRADLLPLSNDMRCEPSKPVVLSSEYLIASVEDFPPCPSSSIIVSATTGHVSLVARGEVTACVHAGDRLVMIMNGRGSCHTLAGEQVWELSKSFSGGTGGRGGIVPLQDGSFVFYHYAHAVYPFVQVALVDSQGREEWWLECGGSDGANRKIYHDISAEVRGDAGILLTCEAVHGGWVHLISWDGKTVFRWETEEPKSQRHPWVL